MNEDNNTRKPVLVGEAPAETVWLEPRQTVVAVDGPYFNVGTGKANRTYNAEQLTDFLALVLEKTGAKRVVATVEVEMKEQK